VEQGLRRDLRGAAFLLALGVGLRLWFCAAFPTQPFSDFSGLIAFGLRLRDEGLFVPGWHWVQFNPGLPLLLSVLFRVAPHGTAQSARVATAVLTGLTPLLPFLIWRPILTFRWRMTAGLALALWPGQIFFSGVVAQENWVLIPVVALAALAVRVLREPGSEGYPIAAGLLLAAAVGIRQEMLVVMLLPALAGAGLGRGDGRRAARAARLAAAAAIPLLLLAAQRHAATGRFAVTTEHGGLSVLGTLVPGSAAAGWLDPTLFVASVEPALLRDPVALRSAAWRLAAREFARRYRFHVFRASAAALRLAVESDGINLYWGLEAPQAFAPDAARAGRAAAWAAAWRPVLRIGLALLSGLFAAAFVRGLARRDPAILVLSVAVLVKLAIHAVASPLGRLMVPAIALALLVVALTIADVSLPAQRAARLRFLATGVLTAVVLFVALGPLQRLAVAKDETPPLVSRFPLSIAGGGGFAECSVESGRLTAIAGDRAWLASAGTPGRVSCLLPELDSAGSLRVDLEGAPARVEADGQERSRDGASSTLPSGWAPLVLSKAGSSPPRSLAIETGPSTVGFGFVRRAPGSQPLPRDRALP
jgi:hypothetical protein